MNKKIKTLAKVGIGPVVEGIYNLNVENIQIENIAKQRASICVGCPLMILEPIKSLRIVDIRIPEISEMMCDDCGCSIPLKTRQNKSICKNWLNL